MKSFKYSLFLGVASTLMYNSPLVAADSAADSSAVIVPVVADQNVIATPAKPVKLRGASKKAAAAARAVALLNTQKAQAAVAQPNVPAAPLPVAEAQLQVAAPAAEVLAQPEAQLPVAAQLQVAAPAAEVLTQPEAQLPVVTQLQVADLPPVVLQPDASTLAPKEPIIVSQTTLDNAPPPTASAEARAENAVNKLMEQTPAPTAVIASSEDAPAASADADADAEEQADAPATAAAPMEEQADAPATAAAPMEEQADAPIAAALTPEQLAARKEARKAARKAKGKKPKTAEQLAASKVRGAEKSAAKKAARKPKTDEERAALKAAGAANTDEEKAALKASRADRKAKKATRKAKKAEEQKTWAVLVLNQDGSINLTATRDFPLNKAKAAKSPPVKVIDAPVGPSIEASAHSDATSTTLEPAAASSTEAPATHEEHHDAVSATASTEAPATHEEHHDDAAPTAASTEAPVKQEEAVIVKGHEDGPKVDTQHVEDNVVKLAVAQDQPAAKEAAEAYEEAAEKPEAAGQEAAE